MKANHPVVRVLLWCGIFSFLGLWGSGDTVFVKDKDKKSRKIEGKITQETDLLVTILDYEGKSQVFQRSDLIMLTHAKSKIDAYEEKKAAMENTADKHYELAVWCKENKLNFLVQKEYDAALALNPDHEKTRAALGFKKYGDKWLTEDEYMKSQGKVKYKGKWMDKTKASEAGYVEPVTFTFTAVYAGDCTKKDFADLAKRFQQGDEALYNAMEGQLYISKITIKDKTPKGDIIIKNLDSDSIAPGVFGNAAVPYDPNMTWPDYWVKIGGKFMMITFIHEFNHAIAGSPDEADQSCAMGGAFEATTYCEVCWGRLKKKYPHFKHPRPKKDWDQLPELQIEIVDQ
ncbi:MAG: hypothetical protein HZA48_12560 [Planctomycetes bacterium]|nr:hypothetical protein [Planctomycetota bacterium]